MKKYTIGLFVLALAANLFAESPDDFYKLMKSQHATGAGVSGITGTPALGAYGINTEKDEFWTMTFGATQTIRKFYRGVNGSGWSNFYAGYGDYTDPNGTSIIFATESDLGRVACADPDFSTGETDVARGGALATGSFVLNPSIVVFKGITYQPGELALITSITGAKDPKYRKVVLLYDLRQIGEPTDKQPDYDTGTSGVSSNPNPGGIFGAFGQTDWNDCFHSLVTGEMILNSIGENVSGKYFNYGRQVVWAPDGSSVYFAGFTSNRNFNDSDPDDIEYWCGIWKYDFADEELKWIYREPTRDYRCFYCEMAAVDTGVRDFTDGIEAGVQILFSGTPASGNEGGLNCIVDNDSANTAVYTVLDAQELESIAEKPANVNNIKNIAVSSGGDLYFYCTGSGQHFSGVSGILYEGAYSIYRYDVKGRLYAVCNRAQMMNFHHSNGTSIGGSTGAVGMLQLYNNLFDKNMLTFRSTPLKAPCGIELFEPCDFNHDSVVTIEDLELFRDQRIANDNPDVSWLTGENGEMGIFDVSADYINCDINGNSMYKSVLVGDPEAAPDACQIINDKRYFNEPAVTQEDAEVLYQFIPAGDANLDGVVNAIDFATFAQNYNTGNSSDDRKNFSQGDFDFDGDIDESDLILLANYWLVSVEN